MSKFLTKLKCEINNTLRYDYDGDVIGSVDKPIKLIDSLGENARRLLEIGIVQDRLAELGFSIDGLECKRYIGEPAANSVRRGKVFFNDYIAVLGGCFDAECFEYTTPTWQEDLINKVKGLIECNN